MVQGEVSGTVGGGTQDGMCRERCAVWCFQMANKGLGRAKFTLPNQVSDISGIVPFGDTQRLPLILHTVYPYSSNVLKNTTILRPLRLPISVGPE